MSEVERLKDYYPFDEDVLEQVSEVAERQRKTSWSEIASSLPDKYTYEPKTGKPIEVLDIRPSDYESTQVYYLPMGNTLDPSMSFRVATLAAVQPEKRIISFSNPGAPGLGKGKLKPNDAVSLLRYGDNLRPLVDPSLQYLGKQGIDAAVHVGYSY